MPVKCEACLRTLTDERVTREGVTEGAVVSDPIYEAVDAVLGRVHVDLEFRSRLGLAHHVHRVQTWFRFHGPWLGEILPKAKGPAPVATKDCYALAAELCEYFSKKPWADEIHLDACAAHRELVREIFRLGSR